MSNDNPRPILITIIGILYVIGAIAVGIMAVMFFVAGNKPVTDIFTGDLLVKIQDMLAQANITWEQLSNAMGVLFAVLAFIYLIMAAGMLKGWWIFWYIGVIVNIIGLAVGIYSIFAVSVSSIVGVIISAIILWYLFTPKVKKFFLG